MDNNFMYMIFLFENLFNMKLKVIIILILEVKLKLI